MKQLNTHGTIVYIGELSTFIRADDGRVAQLLGDMRDRLHVRQRVFVRLKKPHGPELFARWARPAA
jgi:hypothetical protein